LHPVQATRIPLRQGTDFQQKSTFVNLILEEIAKDPTARLKIL